MKTAVISALLLAAVCAVHSADAGRVNVHEKPTQSYEDKEEETKIHYTRLVQDHAGCGSRGNKIAMCASKDFICRMKGNQMAYASEPKCLPIEKDTHDSATKMALESTAPWEACDPANEDVNRPLCRFSFECMCRDPKRGTDCTCMPPDTVRAFVKDDSLACGEQKAKCGDKEYCRWESEDKQACGLKPYFQEPTKPKKGDL
ncbi:TPA: hypothetical protein N0F65_007551 [Lagenidium giganteum]|uniref:Uncharacterized protein n=1 Tax=Lagenidium giganteum TaxID=4803 RepID=A0AAV2ZND6_9STRA|nr:TPA: hypothetical protein N0F65_007551 [Lagenidium giganteum]